MNALELRRPRSKKLSDCQPADTSIRSILDRLNRGEEQHIVASPSLDLTQERFVDDRRSRFRAGVAIAAGIGGVTLAAVVAMSGVGSLSDSDMAQPALDTTPMQITAAGKGDLQKEPLAPARTATETLYPQTAAAPVEAAVTPTPQHVAETGRADALFADDTPSVSNLLLASPLQLWTIVPTAVAAPPEAAAAETNGTTAEPAVSAPARASPARKHARHAFRHHHHHQHRHRHYAALPAATAEGPAKREQQQADAEPQKPLFQGLWKNMFGAK